jgi:hypothetical protein
MSKKTSPKNQPAERWHIAKAETQRPIESLRLAVAERQAAQDSLAKAETTERSAFRDATSNPGNAAMRQKAGDARLETELQRDRMSNARSACQQAAQSARACLETIEQARGALRDELDDAIPDALARCLLPSKAAGLLTERLAREVWPFSIATRCIMALAEEVGMHSLHGPDPDPDGLLQQLTEQVELLTAGIELLEDMRFAQEWPDVLRAADRDAVARHRGDAEMQMQRMGWI